MKLFWKVFLLLLVTLLVTATISNWLGEKWRTENQLIETRLAMLSSMGETAVNVYEEDGADALHRWLRYDLRSRHAFGYLADQQGARIHGSFGRGPGRGQGRNNPPSEHMALLIRQAIETGQSVTQIEPPRLGIARPLQGAHGSYVWVAVTLLSPDEMRKTGNTMKLLQLIIALITISAVSFMLSRMLTGPIRSLQHTSEKLGRGDLASRVAGNVSERDDELGELGRTMDLMAHRLDGLVNSHKKLLRDISHELRSPLARLQVALELARNAAGGRANAELDRIGKESEELDSLIGEVLTLSRFEQGAVEMQREPLELDEMLDEIIADASFEAGAVGKQVNSHGKCDFTIEADPLWITRAFDNVIRNAIRYTPDGNCVDIKMESHGNAASIAIRDHGPGVPDAALSQLFEPFFRVSDARERARNHGGYGLGLSIARYAIEQHHGTITAANHPDGGLIITINL